MIDLLVYVFYVSLVLFAGAVLPLKPTRIVTQHLLDWLSVKVTVGKLHAPMFGFAGWWFLFVTFFKYVAWYMKFVAEVRTGPRTLETKAQLHLSKWIHERETYSYAALAMVMLSLHLLHTARRTVHERAHKAKSAEKKRN
jgi:hypothetical protein